MRGVLARKFYSHVYPIHDFKKRRMGRKRRSWQNSLWWKLDQQKFGGLVIPIMACGLLDVQDFSLFDESEFAAIPDCLSMHR